MLYSLSFRKTSQLDKQLFFDFYGVSLLSAQYLEQNPYAKEYKDMIVQQVKEEYVPLITKMVYAELEKWFETYLVGGQKNWKKELGFELKDLIHRNIKIKDLTLEQIAYIYKTGRWKKGFWGFAWEDITESLIQLINTADTKQLIIIIDHINDIEHSKGLIFHDFPKVEKWFSDALNIKAQATPEQLIPYLSSDIQKFVTEDLQIRGQEVVAPEEYLTIPESEKIKLVKSPNAFLEVFRELAKDEDEDVRWSVAESLTTPPEILAELSKNKDYYIRWFVAYNPSTPPEALAELAKDKNENILMNIAYNPSTPPEALAELAKNPDPEIRYRVATNRGTFPITLEELTKDPDPNVRREAKERVKELEGISFSLNMRKKANGEENIDPNSPPLGSWVYVTKQEVRRLYIQEAKGIYDEELLDRVISGFLTTLGYWKGSRVQLFKKFKNMLEQAKTPQEKMIAIDQVINTAHSLGGKYGDYLIIDFDASFFDELSNLKISSLNMRKKSYIMYNDKGQKFEVNL